MPAVKIDLVSDTATRPTAAMRRAMAEAPVGDEQRGEDPSVRQLCERVADLLGKEAAIFLPSGIMCNQIAIVAHCSAGDEILAADNAHILQSEGAMVAALAGALVSPVEARKGIFRPDDLALSIRRQKLRAPRPKLVCIEQTSNRGGSSIWPLPTIEAVTSVARANGLAMHMGGARLMNAVFASGVSAAEFAAPIDSIWLGLTKGLGCPVGAVLAGSRDVIDAACWWKHRLGGAMRQAGILAAAGLYALDHHVGRLKDDHRSARNLAHALATIHGLRVVPSEVETNIVFFDLTEAQPTADDLAAQLLAEGIRLDVESKTRLRAVPHMDIDEDDILATVAAIGRLLASEIQTQEPPGE